MKSFKTFFKSLNAISEVSLPLSSDLQDEVRRYLDIAPQKIDLTSIEFSITQSENLSKLLSGFKVISFVNFPRIIYMKDSDLSPSCLKYTYYFSDISLLLSSILSSSVKGRCSLVFDVYLDNIRNTLGNSGDHVVVIHADTIDLSSLATLLVSSQSFKVKTFITCTSSSLNKMGISSPPYGYSLDFLTLFLNSYDLNLVQVESGSSVNIFALNYE